jgi:Protein of unknown function (DUF1592)/Protein of unknown function (DUF1588)/Protein of unknown function (DUF1585)/Protein of unknown function (DUF1587)/Protein of unknown function (DUF1595)
MAEILELPGSFLAAACRVRSTIAVWARAFALALMVGSSGAAEISYSASIQPLISEHCAKCHNAEKHKGSVDFSGFTDNLSVIKDRKLWARSLEQIESGDMPPDDEKQLTAEAKAKLIADIRYLTENFDFAKANIRDPGPSLLRRLTRVEYENTIRDLTGIVFDAGREAGIPMEDNGSSFANLAATLNLPPSLMEKYFVAADKILDRLFMSADELKKLASKDYRSKMQAKADEEAAKKFFAALGSANEASRDAVSGLVTNFMRHAYRRPVSTADTDRVMRFYGASLKAGEARELALRKALKPMLVSPQMLYRLEQDRAPNGSDVAYKISEVELATRLSYFLWSSPPDEELLAAAEKNELSKTLDAQVKRMLASPRSEALTKNFAGHWLHIEKIADARPSREFFPAFSDTLKKAMREEIEMFFNKLREEDRPVTEMLDCDYAYANWELGKLYELKDANSKELMRVALPKDSPRGGLLGMAGVLAMNAHTNRTSPTLRGKWILEVVLGKPPPPPPPNVAPLKPNKKGEPPKSLREQLAQHSTQANCAGCHKRIDPLGFALENFDAIGAWRVSTNEVKLDTDGVLPTGEKFSGVRELKRIILTKQDDFLRNLVSQMLTYALGRELDYYDEAPIREIQTALKKDGTKFSALVLGIVKSFPFQQRKNAAAASVSSKASP